MLGRKKVSAAIELGTGSVKVLLGTEDEELKKINFLSGYEQAYEARTHKAMSRGGFVNGDIVINALQTALEKALKLCESESRFFNIKLVPHIANCYVAFSCDEINAKIIQATRSLGALRLTITEKDLQDLRSELIKQNN
ncbi:MAG: hypothetical protein ACRC37_08185, partial [Lentisphaeria bacterium]